MMKPASPTADGLVIPGEIQTFIEQLQHDDDDDDFFRQYLHLPNDEPPAYVQASVDGRDDTSTNLGSESHVPPLTSGQSLSPSSHSRASPSSPGQLGLEDAEPKAVLSVPWPSGGFDDISSTDCLRHVGGGPDIQIQGPIPPPPTRIDEDDMSTNLSPRSSSHRVPALGPSAQAMPVKRGRSNPLSGEKRVKVSNMRKIKACMRCRIRKRECDEDTPCKHCRKAFPKQRGVCVREKLSAFRFPGDGQNTDIWTRESTRASLLRQNWQLCGIPRPFLVKFHQAEDSPGLALTLQPYVVNARPFALATGHSYTPLYAGISGASKSTWDSGRSTQPEPNMVMGLCLAPGQEQLPRDLLGWAEKQLSGELRDKKAPDFESSILAFLLVYRDSPLKPQYSSSNSSSREKKALACVDSKNLVRKTCEMRCWYFIWQTSKLYAYTHGGAPDPGGHSDKHSRLPPTALWELRKMTAEGLIACEKEILLELDEMSPDGARLIELPLWACIWQMILIYRRLVAGSSNVAHSQLGGSVHGGTAGFNEVFALPVVEHLYRLLILKYNAYFGSTSPIYPKKGQPPTTEVLAGDEDLKRKWDNLSLRRKEFYLTITNGVESDLHLKNLVIDIESTLEHRLRRRPKS